MITITFLLFIIVVCLLTSCSSFIKYPIVFYIIYVIFILVDIIHLQNYYSNWCALLYKYFYNSCVYIFTLAQLNRHTFSACERNPPNSSAQQMLRAAQTDRLKYGLSCIVGSLVLFCPVRDYPLFSRFEVVLPLK